MYYSVSDHVLKCVGSMFVTCSVFCSPLTEIIYCSIIFSVGNYSRYGTVEPKLSK